MLDYSLPGAALQLSGQSLTLRDSVFEGLSFSSDASLIVTDAHVTLFNTSFVGNRQAPPQQLLDHYNVSVMSVQLPGDRRR